MEPKLKHNKNTVPSGIYYTDPRTGMSYNLYELGMRETIRKIIQHRSSNPTFYLASETDAFDVDIVRRDLLREVYKKRPDLFQGYNAAAHPQKIQVSAPKVTTPKTCQCGGTEFEPVCCPTCSGKRITGYKCVNCGKVSKK